MNLVLEFDRWCEAVPVSICNDTLWRMRVYPLALYASDLGWDDVTRLHQDGRTRSLADQLYRALCSISANIAEGYSRGSGKDRARFYEYALGSARESRDWYFKARHRLDTETAKKPFSNERPLPFQTVIPDLIPAFAGTDPCGGWAEADRFMDSRLRGNDSLSIATKQSLRGGWIVSPRSSGSS